MQSNFQSFILITSKFVNILHILDVVHFSAVRQGRLVVACIGGSGWAFVYDNSAVSNLILLTLNIE